MRRIVLSTADGSRTIRLPDWDEQYHSRHGALAEARHVFLKAGLHHFLLNHPDRQVRIFEMGFGTGLNAALTLQETAKGPQSVHYTGIEAYPVQIEELEALAYWEVLHMDREAFLRLHRLPWSGFHQVGSHFYLQKIHATLQETRLSGEFNLVFFDAFGPRVQPELWEEPVFRKIYDSLEAGGVMVTYSAKGSVRRALQSVGFDVERIPGPPGKREMLRATRRS